MKNTWVMCFLALGLISICRCDDPPLVESRHSIWFQNNDTKVRLCLVTYSYPDTSLPDLVNSWELRGMPVNEKIPYNLNEESWKNVEKNSSAKLCVFIFDSDTVSMYSWEEMKQCYKILMRYDLSAQELKNIKNTITYP